MVSFGPGTAATDVFEFTIGAVGLTGPQGLKGEKGDQGEKGDTGAAGPQGLQGPSGVTGLMSLPVFQNKPAAIAGGVAVGSFWVQEGSGQVFRMMDSN